MTFRRRDFLRKAAAVAGGAYVAARGLSAQPSRREVSIGGRPVRVIDAHAHCVIFISCTTSRLLATAKQQRGPMKKRTQLWLPATAELMCER